MTTQQLDTVLISALEYSRGFISKGNVATYIPKLGTANPNHLGVCIKTVGGNTFSHGDYLVEFTMQSISKTISLILALQTAGYKKVFSKVSVEPTGDAFNSIVKLETKSLRPLNPMINAGAIAVASCISGDNSFEQFLALVKKLCGRDSICLDDEVYLSEKEAGMRNRSMAYLMQSENILERDSEQVLDLYFKMCSVKINCEDLANYSLLLANNGINPTTKEVVIESWIVRIVKTLMVTCGMYDGSGDFAMKVGLPAKSGVGGGIIASVERNMGIAVFSPPLDEKGNSCGGYHLLEYLSHNLKLHYFSGQEPLTLGL